MLFKIAKACDMICWRENGGGLTGNGIVPHCRVIRGFPCPSTRFPHDGGETGLAGGRSSAQDTAPWRWVRRGQSEVIRCRNDANLEVKQLSLRPPFLAALGQWQGRNQRVTSARSDRAASTYWGTSCSGDRGVCDFGMPCRSKLRGTYEVW